MNRDYLTLLKEKLKNTSIDPTDKTDKSGFVDKKLKNMPIDSTDKTDKSTSVGFVSSPLEQKILNFCPKPPEPTRIMAASWPDDILGRTGFGGDWPAFTAWAAENGMAPCVKIGYTWRDVWACRDCRGDAGCVKALVDEKITTFQRLNAQEGDESEAVA